MSGRQRRNRETPGVKIGQALDRLGASVLGSLTKGWTLLHLDVMFGVHMGRQYCEVACVRGCYQEKYPVGRRGEASHESRLLP